MSDIHSESESLAEAPSQPEAAIGTGTGTRRPGGQPVPLAVAQRLLRARVTGKVYQWPVTSDLVVRLTATSTSMPLPRA